MDEADEWDVEMCSELHPICSTLKALCILGMARTTDKLEVISVKVMDLWSLRYLSTFKVLLSGSINFEANMVAMNEHYSYLHDYNYIKYEPNYL